MIDLQNISKEIHNDDLDIRILHCISLVIGSGEFVSIMGPSGSGKSTLMNIIGFLDTITAGSYRFKNHDVSTFDEDKLAGLRSSEIGFVFQAFNLLPKTTALENVKMPLMYSGSRRSERERDATARQALESVGLSHRLEHLSNQLSGGEKQRVAIARALVNNPSIILADEPTGNLDSASGIQVMGILQSLNAQGKTIVLVTHEQATAEHAQRIVRLHDGAIVSETKVAHQRLAERATELK